jgi:hypothetical protein
MLPKDIRAYFISAIAVSHYRGSAAIKTSDDVGHCFQKNQGLGQGDPLSPMLFNKVADILVIMIERAKNVGQIIRQ